MAYDLRMSAGLRLPSGHVFKVDRARGAVWYAKYRLPDGRQVQRKIGPASTERGRPAAGYFTQRTADAWLRDLLDQARWSGQRHGTLPGMTRTGATFADAAAEWLRYIEHDRRRKPSTVNGYQAIVRSQLLPTFGSMPIESITPSTIEAWLAGVDRASSTRVKALVLLHGIFQRARKVWSLPANPVADVEKPPLAASSDIQVFSPDEVWALVRAADSEQDATVFLMAAFTGLRMGELLALRWRDVDFAGSAVRVRASYYAGHLTTPKSGKIRAVPLAPDVARALAQLGRRVDWIGDDDLVFAGVGGDHLDGSALRRRYKHALARAGLRSLRFHDLRHTFGTRMIAKTDIRRVQEWMGHADIQTTMRYLHFSPRSEDAGLVAEAFELKTDRDVSGRVGTSRDVLPETGPGS
jgi:integrase